MSFVDAHPAPEVKGQLSRMATKTTSKTQKTKPRSRVKASAVTQRATYAELRQELEARNRDLAEFLQREKTALKDLQDRDQQLADSAKELQDCKRQLTEALEQQTATSEILGVIASSPTDVQPVLDVVAERAAKLCDATDAVIYHIDGDVLHQVAVIRADATRASCKTHYPGQAVWSSGARPQDNPCA